MNKDNKKEIYPKRAALIELSNQAVQFRQQKIEAAPNEAQAAFWATRTINYILLNHFYGNSGCTEFNSFDHWKDQGATIKKGESAFMIWGQPVKKNANVDFTTTEVKPEQYNFYPIRFLFNEEQVHRQADIRQNEPQAQVITGKLQMVNLDEIL